MRVPDGAADDGEDDAVLRGSHRCLSPPLTREDRDATERRKKYLRHRSRPPPPSQVSGLRCLPPFCVFGGSISLNIPWFCPNHLRCPATGVLAAAAVKRPLQPPQEGERNNKTELRSAHYRCGVLTSKAL
ncbi:hypothetical protein PIB30_072851 [Stylosanthes scabra]|uniref:Uncharacterized protein n=1 Tax=Stylosanthes scabra TaxID=79078 RepID=A0ABU6WMK0_9FABA|nr:hypothetical protein [Stylosanthes scabra]